MNKKWIATLAAVAFAATAFAAKPKTPSYPSYLTVEVMPDYEKGKKVMATVVMPKAGAAIPADLVIPDGVTAIMGFDDCRWIRSVTIPKSVKVISQNSFKRCTSLKGIFGGTIAQWNAISGEGKQYFTSVHCTDGIVGVAEIPAYLVMKGMKITGCDKNKLPDNLVIPEGVTEIGRSAFKECTYLESVTIPSSVTSIGGDYDYYNYNGNGAFNGCTSLKKVVIPDSVTEIQEGTFYGCISLNAVIIPDSVTKIGRVAFNGCTSLESVTIGKGVTLIYQDAFRGCTSLKNIVIPESVTVIGGDAFAGCTSLANIMIPNNVTEIRDKAFKNCTSLASIMIPNNVTSIGYSAFEKCTSLTSIVIPRGVTSINGSAFADCKSLKSVSIPRSVTSIGSHAFSKCPNLSVQYDGTKAQWEAISKYPVTFDKGITIRGTDGNIVVN